MLYIYVKVVEKINMYIHIYIAVVMKTVSSEYTSYFDTTISTIYPAHSAQETGETVFRETILYYSKIFARD